MRSSNPIALEEEAAKLQVSANALNGLNNVFVQLVKHLKIEISKEVQSVPVSFHLTNEERKVIAESCIQHLLFERTGKDAAFDLSIKLLCPFGKPA
jgi:hypothetical protein